MAEEEGRMRRADATANGTAQKGVRKARMCPSDAYSFVGLGRTGVTIGVAESGGRKKRKALRFGEGRLAVRRMDREAAPRHAAGSHV